MHTYTGTHTHTLALTHTHALTHSAELSHLVFIAQVTNGWETMHRPGTNSNSQSLVEVHAQA